LWCCDDKTIGDVVGGRDYTAINSILLVRGGHYSAHCFFQKLIPNNPVVVTAADLRTPRWNFLAVGDTRLAGTVHAEQGFTCLAAMRTGHEVGYACLAFQRAGLGRRR
jgi:hypothetical protein